MHVKEEKTTTECVYNLGSKKELYPRNQLKKAPNNAGPPSARPSSSVPIPRLGRFIRISRLHLLPTYLRKRILARLSL